ncbi:hypothetical protein [Bradyrhizobium prioriisuperbiae]|uniref:terminase small subunit-like protein n=1 Tax=Bradyrhizobium prioriisuperbiae TaxID=2854389 RepID=UPI0028EDECEA|nr:hypothetical protein [Bradyrhizobium prioritasuperba]
MKGRLGYSREIADRICVELDRGRPLRTICHTPGMPAYNTVRGWARSNRDGFGDRTRRLRRRGRPTCHAPDIAEAICVRLSEGQSLSEICRDAGMPNLKTVCRWVRRNRGGFGARVRRARLVGYFKVMDEMLDIADDSRGDWRLRRKANGEDVRVFDRNNVARARLRIKVRRWKLANAMPKGRDWLAPEPDPPAGAGGMSWVDLLKAVDGKSVGLPKSSQSARRCG